MWRVAGKIKYCVMSDIPILSLYASTDLTRIELEQELKKLGDGARDIPSGGETTTNHFLVGAEREAALL